MAAPFWETASGRLGLAEPLFLGILNATPDSFSDGGRFLDPDRALDQARSLMDQGARALDLGAESTRPGAAPVPPGEEWARLEPVLARLRTELPDLPVSLDTRHPEVAARGIRLGAAAINDVTGFQDPELLHMARNSGCGLIAMRSRLADSELVFPPYGGPGNLSADPAAAELAAVRDRLLQAGIRPERILLDPGFGFGTTFGEEQAIWAGLGALPGALRWPVERFCIGISRKRFLAWRAASPALPPGDRDGLGERAHREAIRLGYRVFRSHAVSRPALREAGPADAAVLGRLQVASWRATYRGILPESSLAGLSEEVQTAAFAQSLAQAGPGFRIWLLESRGRPMGFAVAGPSRDPQACGPDPGAPRTGEIHAIYLLPEAWGQGLGRALMDRALAGLGGDGFGAAALWVLERNARARAFYEAGGWTLAGAPRTQWQDGIALRQVQYRLVLDPGASGL